MLTLRIKKRILLSKKQRRLRDGALLKALAFHRYYQIRFLDLTSQVEIVVGFCPC